MRERKRAALMAAVISLTGFATVATAATIDLTPGSIGDPDSVLLSDLLPGGAYADGASVLDKLFYNFSNYFTSGIGTTAIPSTAILVSGITNGSPTGVGVGNEIGLLFQVPMDVSGNGKLLDVRFEFDVKAGPGFLITDNTLTFIGEARSTDELAKAQVIETAIDPNNPLVPLANKVVVDNGVDRQVDHVDYPYGVPIVHIKKDVSVSTLLSTDPNATASMSDFTQTFSQTVVPLPASAWGGLSLLAMLGAARARKALKA